MLGSIILGSVLLAIPAIIFLKKIENTESASEAMKRVPEFMERLANGECSLSLNDEERTSVMNEKKHEESQLVIARSELAKEKNELNRVSKILDEAIWRGRKAGISVNKDGTFSARSQLGKSIRAIIEKYQPMKNYQAARTERMESMIISRMKSNEEIMGLAEKTLPRKRLEKFDADLHESIGIHLCRTGACKSGLWTWGIVFCVIYAYGLLPGKETSFWASAVVADIAALVAYKIGYKSHLQDARRLVDIQSDSQP